MFEIQLPEPDHSLVKVYVAQRVIQKICAAVLQYAHSETGESLIGFCIDTGKPIGKMVLLDTIAPAPDAIVREWAMTAFGDDRQYAIFRWYHENWELYRQIRRASYGNAIIGKWDAPLKHMGDWHKQPGLVEPSRGDLQTARQFIKETEIDYLIAPIATLGQEVANVASAGNTLFGATDVAQIRIDFWMLKKQDKAFKAIRPIVVDDNDLPRLPPLAWHISDGGRFAVELDRLETANISVLDIVQLDTRDHPPLDICFVLHEQGAQYAIIAITPATYPLRPPTWRVAPLIRPRGNEDFFETLYRLSTPIQVDIEKWTQAHWLVEGVKAIKEQKPS